MTGDTRFDPTLRLAIELPVQVLLPGSGAALLLRTLNLGEGGMFVLTETPLPVGTRVRLHLDLPGGDPLHGSARVVRSVMPTRQVEPAGMALRLDEEDPRPAARLETFIAGVLALRAGVQPTEKPRAGAWAPPTPEFEGELDPVLAPGWGSEEGRQ